ncbi:aldehyde dehydrogenase (NAD+) [Saprolegnia diclina VS20]|uniref:Aldehyde dehydrogenase (NAD+) n=1 Tax=Saprolegnia diclina (strain VS20) TaxID=1156394 RepID=T0QQP5_SAPDV|nr:aldehyde dehydrogenase (NAD+) [Saprolegnia diclina VS20]EQC36230.1 aldehyde dehydrogenase (NAD+) [Saprolegnia diclina VS20]|eukprot:XP_008610336.1 aldehyde dehydrogenase (NAD+) [Saprolegnia diclina VS20]
MHAVFARAARHSLGARRRFTHHAPAVHQTQLLINGEFVPATSGKTFDTFNPATEAKIASVHAAGADDVDKAVHAARDAFDHGPWRKLSGSQRANLMRKFADLIEANADELAALEALDNGKPCSVAKGVDVDLAIKCIRYYAGWADKITGKTIPIDGPFFCYTKDEPVGVCAQIIPWNFPILMAAWKLGPLLATGCTSVLKPAEQTPLTALRLGELIVEAGFPKGVVNIVPGEGATTGRYLAQHPLVDKVAFTGSTEVGFEIMRQSHPSNLKRVTLELGGKSANIIMPDADLDLAIAASQVGLFHNQGQCCIAGSRVFVHEDIYDEFIAKSAVAAAKNVVGDPFCAKTTQGPQVNEEQFRKILAYIETGKREGARLLTGGKRHGKKGWFIEPTVFADVEDHMTIAKEEIFGPVMSILKFKDVDDVIARANASEYGLGAGVVTKDINNVMKLTNGLRAGTVYVNCYDVFDAAAPFGGFKNSGLGRELGEAGLRPYVENKTVIIKQ